MLNKSMDSSNVTSIEKFLVRERSAVYYYERD